MGAPEVILLSFPLPQMSGRVRELAETAVRIARAHYSSSIRLGAKMLALPPAQNTDANVQALALAIASTGIGCLEVLSASARGGIVLSVQVPGARVREERIRQLVRTPDALPLAVQFVPYTQSATGDGMAEALVVARQVIDYGCYGVTIATDVCTPARREQLQLALTAAGAPADYVPIYTSLAQLETGVRPEHRLFLVVDRADRLGTTLHSLWVRAAAQGVTLCGDAALGPAYPGLGLADLFGLAATEADANARRALLQERLFPRAPTWISDARCVPTLLLALQDLPGAVLVDKRGEKQRLAVPLPAAHRPSRLVTLDTLVLARDQYAQRPGLVVFYDTLASLRLEEWLWFLAGGWGPCRVVVPPDVAVPDWGGLVRASPGNFLRTTVPLPDPPENGGGGGPL